jgi:predicted dithiol-disulfide oxidoreductase (DUF899 family)
MYVIINWITYGHIGAAVKPHTKARMNWEVQIASKYAAEPDNDFCYYKGVDTQHIGEFFFQGKQHIVGGG